MSSNRNLEADPKEPASDPFRPQPQATKPVPVAKAPPVFTVPKEEKVVNRYMFEVFAIHEGQMHGPIEQEAVDESEAIQRVLDDGTKLGGLDRAKCRFQAKCAEQDKRKADWAAAKKARKAAKDAA